MFYGFAKSDYFLYPHFVGLSANGSDTLACLRRRGSTERGSIVEPEVYSLNIVLVRKFPKFEHTWTFSA